MHADILGSFDEELEMECNDARLDALLSNLGEELAKGIDRPIYFCELLRLQGELLELQDCVVSQKLKVVLLFEGRHAAGKGVASDNQAHHTTAQSTCCSRCCTDRARRTRAHTMVFPALRLAPVSGREMVLFDRSLVQ